jgi:energy-coupling factor transporter ATP-binding protein EcfA2
VKDSRLIHFFGPDGAGKTTQAQMLTKLLGNRGYRVREFWVRSPHTVAYVLWRLFNRIGFYRIIWNPFGVGIKIPAVNRNSSIKSFWAFVEFLSVLPHIVRANMFMSRGYRLVAERYLLDTITTVAFFIDDIDFIRSPLAMILIRFIPRNSVLIFIDADFHTILERRTPLFLERMKAAQKIDKGRKKPRIYGYVPDAAVEPREFLDFQRKAYKMLAKSLGAFEIYSPDFSVAETFEMILRFLEAN